MHGDQPCAELLIDDDGMVADVPEILDMAHMPWGTVGATRDDTLRLLNDWFGYRCIPSKRTGIEEGLGRMGAGTRRSLMVSSLALNLSDHYWILPEGSGLRWNDVSMFSNGFCEEAGRCLLGIGGRGDGRSPDCSTDGVVPKMWTRRRTLLKGGFEHNRQQPVNEVIASELMDRLGVPHVPYTLAEADGMTVCECPCIASEEEEMVQARCLMLTKPMPRGSTVYMHLVERCETVGVPGFGTFIDRQIAIDHLMCNSDRHYNNFSVLRDPHSLEAIGFSPIYDTGSSLGFDRETDGISATGFKGRTFKDDLDDQLRLVGDISWLDLDRAEGMTERIRKMVSAEMGEERADAVAELYAARVESLRSWNGPDFRDELSEDIDVGHRSVLDSEPRRDRSGPR